MIEAVAPQDFVLTFVTSALVVLFAAGYAALLAWSRAGQRKGLFVAAIACYMALAGAVYLLSNLAHLDGFWRVVTGVMLLGYLLAPYGIWQLCAASHAREHTHDPPHQHPTTKR